MKLIKSLLEILVVRAVTRFVMSLLPTDGTSISSCLYGFLLLYNSSCWLRTSSLLEVCISVLPSSNGSFRYYLRGISDFSSFLGSNLLIWVLRFLVIKVGDTISVLFESTIVGSLVLESIGGIDQGFEVGIASWHGTEDTACVIVVW